MDILKVLDRLRDFENKMRDMYDWFAACFEGEDPEASIFFRKMAKEEKSHADIVSFEISLVMKDRRSYADIEYDVSEIDKVCEWADSIMEVRPGPTLHEALNIAVEFERDALEHHYRAAMEQSNPQMEKLIRSLGNKDVLHYERLMDFVKARGERLCNPRMAASG